MGETESAVTIRLMCFHFEERILISVRDWTCVIAPSAYVMVVPKQRCCFESNLLKKTKGWLIDLHILRFPDLFRFCEPYCQNFRFL